MTTAMLLEPRIEGDRIVYVDTDTRTLSLSGGLTVVTSYKKEIMERAGLYKAGALVDGVDVEQNYRLDPVAGELVVENRIALPDQEAVADLPQPEIAGPTAD